MLIVYNAELLIHAAKKILDSSISLNLLQIICWFFVFCTFCEPEIVLPVL